MPPIPSIEQLTSRFSVAYGFPVPPALGEIVSAALAWEARTGAASHARAEYTSGIGFDLTIHDDAIYGTAEPLSYVPTARYDIEPPEYFPFGRPGVDGISYGYLVRAPELGAHELPVYEMEPMEAAITLEGDSTAAAVARLYARNAPFRDEYDLPEPLREAARELAAWSSRTGEKELQPQASEAAAPACAGYHFEPSGDGVGVFAPAETFAEKAARFFSMSDRDSRAADDLVADSLTDVRAHLELGYPASALLALRRTYRSALAARHVDEDAVIDRVFPLWQRCYVDLGRSLLAESVARMAIGKREALLAYRRATNYERKIASTFENDGTLSVNVGAIGFVLARRAETFDRDVVASFVQDVHVASSNVFLRFGERNPHRIEVVYEVQKRVIAAASASVDGFVATIDLLVSSDEAEASHIISMLRCLEASAARRSVTRIRVDETAEAVVPGLVHDDWLDRAVEIVDLPR